LNIYSKLVLNTTFFFRLLKWFCLISNLSNTQLTVYSAAKDASPTCSSLTVNLFYGPPCQLTKFGHGFFHALCELYILVFCLCMFMQINFYNPLLRFLIYVIVLAIMGNIALFYYLCLVRSTVFLICKGFCFCPLCDSI